MNRIEHEINLLLEMAASGKLPGYPALEAEDTYFAESPRCTGLADYSSAENDALERQLRALWADSHEMNACIPLILAAVEKSRGQAGRVLISTELYNYTM